MRSIGNILKITHITLINDYFESTDGMNSKIINNYGYTITIYCLNAKSMPKLNDRVDQDSLISVKQNL
jgi:hypothetical protein